MKSVSELRAELVSLGLSQEEADSIKGKQNLLNRLEEMMDPDKDVETSEGAFDNLEEIEELSHEDYEFGTQEWNDHVLSLFAENELHDGKYPNVNALRRLTNKIIGRIVFSGVEKVYPPTSQEGVGRSTVVYRVDVVTPNGGISYSDVADCWHGNSNPIFAVHPSAMASSRAEGRCLRKILGLTVNTYEEMDNPNNPVEMVESSLTNIDIEDFEKQAITSMQKTVINKKTEDMKIDLFKLLKREFGSKYVDLEQMNREDAQKVVKLINDYQSGTDIPEEILV